MKLYEITHGVTISTTLKVTRNPKKHRIWLTAFLFKALRLRMFSKGSRSVQLTQILQTKSSYTSPERQAIEMPLLCQGTGTVQCCIPQSKFLLLLLLLKRELCEATSTPAILDCCRVVRYILLHLCKKKEISSPPLSPHACNTCQNVKIHDASLVIKSDRD